MGLQFLGTTTLRLLGRLLGRVLDGDLDASFNNIPFQEIEVFWGKVGKDLIGW